MADGNRQSFVFHRIGITHSVIVIAENGVSRNIGFDERADERDRFVDFAHKIERVFAFHVARFVFVGRLINKIARD